MSNPIPAPIAQFDGIIYKVATLAAGGFRITLDGTSQDIAQAAYLMPFADTPGVLVHVTFARVSGNDLTEFDGETEKEAKGSGTTVDNRRIAIRRDQRAGG